MLAQNGRWVFCTGEHGNEKLKATGKRGKGAKVGERTSEDEEKEKRWKKIFDLETQ